MSTTDEDRLEGELARAPGGTVATILLVVSGFALLRAAAELVLRVALSYRRPARILLTERGLELHHRTELLGRVIAEKETLVPLQDLALVTREIRYARLGLYAGLVTLSAGTYVGTGLLIDGVRVPGGSPSLLGLGLGAVAIGAGLDFGLVTFGDARAGTCRVVFRKREGSPLCVRGVDAQAADRLLSRLWSSIAPPAGAPG